MDWRSRPTVTPQELARLTGLPLADVGALVQDGTLASTTVRGHVLIYVESARKIFDAPANAEPVDRAARELVDRIRRRRRVA